MQGKRQSADVNPNKYVPDKRDSRDAFSAALRLRYVTRLEEGMRFLSGLGSRVSPNKSDTEFVEEVPCRLSV